MSIDISMKFVSKGGPINNILALVRIKVYWRIYALLSLSELKPHTHIEYIQSTQTAMENINVKQSR